MALRSSASSLLLSLRTSGVASCSAIAGHAICEGNTDRPRFAAEVGAWCVRPAKGQTMRLLLVEPCDRAREDMPACCGDGHPMSWWRRTAAKLSNCWITWLQRMGGDVDMILWSTVAERRCVGGLSPSESDPGMV